MSVLASLQELKDRINQVFRPNSVKAITGADSNSVLNDMADTLYASTYGQQLSIPDGTAELVLNHNLRNQFPIITVFDSNSDDIDCEIEYTDLNNATLRFNPAISGAKVRYR